MIITRLVFFFFFSNVWKPWLSLFRVIRQFKCYQHEELKMPLFDIGSLVTEVHALCPWFYFFCAGKKKKK